jgi:hypothetical protein
MTAATTLCQHAAIYDFENGHAQYLHPNSLVNPLIT